jgi:hypothetical protein
MRRLVLLLAGGMAVIAAGCGGDGGSEQLTHKEFLTQANEICSDYARRIAALGTPTSLDELVSYAPKAQSIAKDSVGKFKKLNPPDEDRANWQRFGDIGDKLIDSLGQLEKAAKDGDQAEVLKLAALGRARDAQSKRVGRAMGATACANT